MIQEVIFRRYNETDINDIIQLHQDALRAIDAFDESGVHDRDLADIDANYIKNDGDFLVGELEGSIVAMGAFRRMNKNTAELKRMRVAVEMQGKGIGKQLLKLLEKEVIAKGYKAIELDTLARPSSAKSLYEHNGYVEVRRESEDQGWPSEVSIYRKEL